MGIADKIKGAGVWKRIQGYIDNFPDIYIAMVYDLSDTRPMSAKGIRRK